MKSSMLFAAVAGAYADSGTDYQCFGNRAHSVTYDIDGDSLETLQNAKVDIAPEPAMNGYCSGKEGDYDFCVGGNTDDCKTGRAPLPISDIFSCDSCFAGLETDLFYSLEIKLLKLKRVELGLRNSHLRGAVEVHGHKDVDAPIASGSIPLIDAAKEARVKFKIAGIIPFDLKISMPTTLEYSLGLHGSLDVLAGADLDVDLGDHFISWEKETGFTVNNTGMSVDLTPKLSLNSGTAAADLGLTVRSEVQADLDSVMWYHLDVVPSLPSTLDFEHTAGETDKICLRSDIDIPLSHEADVHFTLLGKDHDIYHFGPQELLHFHKDQAINKCIDVPFADVVV